MMFGKLDYFLIDFYFIDNIAGAAKYIPTFIKITPIPYPKISSEFNISIV